MTLNLRFCTAILTVLGMAAVSAGVAAQTSPAPVSPALPAIPTGSQITPAVPAAPGGVKPLPVVPAAPASPALPTGSQITPAVPAAPGSAEAFRIRPPYAAASSIVRSTPTLDGVLHDGEWTPFYTINTGPIQGTIYVNWDSNYLYVAALTTAPCDMILDIDTTDNGWLRGADNLEMVVGSATANNRPALAARILDASSNKQLPVWTTQGIALNTILAAGSLNGNTQILQVAVPKDMAGLLLAPGTQIGLRADLIPPGDPNAYVPTAPYEPHLLLDTVLADTQAQSAAGVNPHLALSDYKCIAGQKLFATLSLLNQTDQPMPIRKITWRGMPENAYAIDSITHVNVPPIPATGKIDLGYKTLIAPSLSLGTYALKAVVTLQNGQQVSANASFTVVSPIHAGLDPEPNPLVIVGNTKLTLRVVISSAVPDHFRGMLTLLHYPAGWKLDGNAARSVVVYGEDHTSVSRVVFHLPASTQPGDYPIDARIDWFGQTWNLHTVVHIVSNEAASASKK